MENEALKETIQQYEQEKLTFDVTTSNLLMREGWLPPSLSNSEWFIGESQGNYGSKGRCRKNCRLSVVGVAHNSNDDSNGYDLFRSTRVVANDKVITINPIRFTDIDVLEGQILYFAAASSTYGDKLAVVYKIKEI